MAFVLVLSGLSPGLAAESGKTTAAAFSQAQLDQMMAPVALYPDSLLSQVLMASTYPTQVAEAVKWSKGNHGKKGDDAVKAVQDKKWDPSVASLVAFPEVLAIMGDKPDWVEQMGDAFLAEPDKVMDTVQELRKKAKEAGNLKSTKQQKVVVDNSAQQTIIKIEPADPQVIYVPAYNPTLIYGTWWWPAYPPFYYSPPGYGFATGLMTGIGFGIGIGITNAIWGSFNWHSHDININVNRFNNINVNKRLNVNSNTVSWKRDSAKRRETARNDINRRNLSRNRLSGADSRQGYRGRDAEREKARTALQGKGISPAAERRKLSGAGGERVRDQVRSIDTGRKGLSSGGLEGLRDRGAAGNRDFSRLSSDRSNHALKGIGDDRWGGLGSERGRFSNHSFEGKHEGGFGALSGGGFRDRAGGGGFRERAGGGGFGGFGGHFRRR